VFAVEATKWSHKLAGRMRNMVFGQDAAVDQVVDATLRIREGFQKTGCPAGVMVFGGPPGVGKVQTAKALAFKLMKSYENFRVFDLSEGSPTATAAELFRAITAWESGVTGGPQWGSALRIVVIKAIERVHPSVLGPLLRILTTGCVREQACGQAPFRKCIFILTMNQHPPGAGASAAPGWFQDLLASRIRRDIVDRFDAIVPFAPLDYTAQGCILRLALTELYDESTRRHIRIGMEESAARLVAQTGYTPERGADGLLGATKRMVIDPIREILDANTLPEGGRIDVLVRHGDLVVRATGRSPQVSTKES